MSEETISFSATFDERIDERLPFYSDQLLNIIFDDGTKIIGRPVSVQPGADTPELNLDVTLEIVEVWKDGKRIVPAEVPA